MMEATLLAWPPETALRGRVHCRLAGGQATGMHPRIRGHRVRGSRGCLGEAGHRVPSLPAFPLA